MARRAKLKYTTTKSTIEDAISDAFGELESLGSEMCDWGDNIEEKFSATNKYERIREAQELLENLSAPNIPESLAKIEVELLRPTARVSQSRPDRRDNACMALSTVIEKLNEMNNNDDADSLRDDLENAKDEAESVEFPGMYG